jgi:methyl-accepting chemotaxis protein
VAGEVRTLAQKSAAAAKEIKQLISDSVNKVGTGSKLVSEAGNTMEEIVTSVKRVTDIMDEISAASVEQSAGIDQVNQAITQMDEVTQQNASLVEESAAASTSLEEQAQTLMASVGVFKLSAELMASHRSSASSQSSSRAASVKTPSRNKFTPTTTSNDSDWEEF